MNTRQQFTFSPLSARDLFAKSKGLYIITTVHLDNRIFEFVG